MLVGGVLVLGLYIANKKLIKKEALTLEGVIGSLAVGAIAGALPDLIEPASNPNHRQFFHSIGFGVLLLLVRANLYKSNALDERYRTYFDWIMVAYGSHLFCDIQTPKGLPIIG